MHPTARPLLRAAALGTGLAVLGVAATHVVAGATGDPLTVAAAGALQPVPLGAAVLFTVLGGGAGLGLALLARRFRRPRATFLTVTLVALAAYGVLPFAAAPTTGTAVWLNVMHLVAAAAILPALARELPLRRRAAAVAPGS